MTRAPFRADQVGSILRSPAIKEARAQREKGALSAADLKAVEDAEIKTIIKKQEEAGLKGITDGEYRRAWWHFDFFGGLKGVELYEANHGIQFQGIQTKALALRVTDKLGFDPAHPFLDHFRFTKANVTATAKQTIPSPSVMHYRGGRKGVSTTVYPDIEGFYDDLGQVYKQAVKAFYDAGCRYLQLDDTVWAYLCSEDERQKARARGEDVDSLPVHYAQMINAAIKDRPKDMTITMHICRGNFRSTWITEGGYEPVAERIFNELDLDGYFLEYDTDRAGGFEPLRFVPKGDKRIVLGLVTSKTGALEDRGAIKRRIEEATKYVALDQLCLSPQCGFASTEEGNILTDDEQWAKFGLIVETAKEVWGEI